MSYLTPDKRLVPVFNCIRRRNWASRRAAGHPLARRKALSDHAPIGIIVYDPQTKKVSPLVTAYRNQNFKGPNDLDFDADGNLVFHRSLGHRRRA